jgi:hypothetical protein
MNALSAAPSRGGGPRWRNVDLVRIFRRAEPTVVDRGLALGVMY